MKLTVNVFYQSDDFKRESGFVDDTDGDNRVEGDERDEDDDVSFHIQPNTSVQLKRPKRFSLYRLKAVLCCYNN